MDGSEGTARRVWIIGGIKAESGEGGTRENGAVSRRVIGCRVGCFCLGSYRDVSNVELDDKWTVVTTHTGRREVLRSTDKQLNPRSLSKCFHKVPLRDSFCRRDPSPSLGVQNLFEEVEKSCCLRGPGRSAFVALQVRSRSVGAHFGSCATSWRIRMDSRPKIVPQSLDPNTG